MPRNREPRKLELISLVDVVFLLLIFFIVSLVFGIDRNDNGKGSGPEEGSLLDINLPKVENITKIAKDSLTITICLAGNQDGIQGYIIDSNYPDIATIINKIKNRILELRDITAGLSLDQMTEGRQLFQAWHSHVVVPDLYPTGLDINRWRDIGYSSLDWYPYPRNMAIAMHNDFKQRFSETFTNYIDYMQVPNKEKKDIFSIAADASVPYRLVYDILEVLDANNIQLLNVRMTKEQ